jgi:streptogrisin B
VCKSGRTTLRSCGWSPPSTSRPSNVTAVYSDGPTVNGLIKTNVRVAAGDSGRPPDDGATTLGLTPAVGGDCATGAVSFFQPAAAALNALGGVGILIS